MPGSRPCRRTHRPGAAGAFTLVELVTAASLMTVMMIGVVQIFAIVTKTAGDAEGLQFAMEQGRSFFDTLHRDVQGLTRDGYLRIVKGYVPQAATTQPVATILPATTTAWYGTDTLAMTSVGLWSGVWAPTEPQPIAPAAEVVYTRNVFTPDARLTVDGKPLNDERCGILGRGQWLFGGQGGAAGNAEDYAKVSALCSLFNQPGVASPTNRYVDPRSDLVVWPVKSASGTPDHPQSLQRVMACRVSEFYVEYLAYDTTKGDYDWQRQSGVLDCRPGNPVGCPRAIRVTIAIHDPDDRSPTPLAAGTRYRGYAMQEVFWIGDP
ncbi:MAG TPA: hypothetical protein VM243_04745 [Phycisphaerae bacterium]|nr:hypothetical protein [Phycisphaerae bacterium]